MVDVCALIPAERTIKKMVMLMVFMNVSFLRVLFLFLFCKDKMVQIFVAWVCYSFKGGVLFFYSCPLKRLILF